MIDSWQGNRYAGVQEIILKDGERILGVKSGNRGESDARHHDLQFVVGRVE